MASIGQQIPEQQWSLSFHQWLTCEAYLGHCPQEPNDTRHQPYIEEQLARAVATLHRRTEEATYMAQKVYVSVVPTGLQLSMSPASDGHGFHNPQQRITKTCLTSAIARCSSNHHPCPRIFVWVCESETTGPYDSNRGRMEYHGVLCQTQRDAIQLAHTLSNAFQCMLRVMQRSPNLIPQPLGRGNALPPLPYHPLAEVPLADIAMLPSYVVSAPARRGEDAVKGNEMSCTFAGDMTVAISSPPPDYQSRPGSAMSISARRVASPLMSSNGDNGMTYLD